MPDNPFTAIRKERNTANPQSTANPFTQIRQQREKQPGFLARMTDRARALNQGLLFGFGDEYAAFMKSMMGEGSYDQHLQQERARLAQQREREPVMSTALEMGGAIPTAIMAPQGMAARAAAPLAARMASGVVGGTAAGGAYGFGQGEGGLAARTESSVLPAALGGAAGALGPAIGKGVGAVAERASRGRTARAQGIEPETVDILRDTLQADMKGAGARLAQAGETAMVADTGPNSRAILDVAMQRSGPAGVAAREAIDRRTLLAADRMTGALDRTLGRPEGVRTIEANLRSASASPVRAAYEEAYSRPIDYAADSGRRIEELMRSRVPARAIREANALMRLAGDPQSMQIKATIEDGVVTGFEQLPDVRQLDYITRGLNQMADREAGKGAMGSTTQKGRALTGLSRELRGLVREAVPEYAQALGMAAEPIQARKALQLGRGAIGRMPRDELRDEIAGMSESELRHVAQGVREAIDDQMAAVNQAFTDPNMDAREAAKALKALSSRASRDKVRMIVGDEAADSLFDELDQAAVAFELKAAVAQNSKTFARQALEDRVGRRMSEGPANALMRGEPVQAARSFAAEVLGGSPSATDARADRVYTGLVDALTRPGNLASVHGLAAAPAPIAAGSRADRLASTLAGRAPIAAVPLLPDTRRRR